MLILILLQNFVNFNKLHIEKELKKKTEQI